MPYPLERCPYCKQDLDTDFPVHWENEHVPEDAYNHYYPEETPNVDTEA